MKRLSVKKRELAQAIAYRTHADFDDGRWSWEVSFNPKAADPEAHILLVNPDVDTDTSYVFENEDTMNPMAFVGLPPDYEWGEEGVLTGESMDGKELESVHIPEAVLGQIESSLRKHVEYNGETYTINYY